MKKAVFTVINDLNYDQRMHKICGSLQDCGYDVTLIGRKKKSSLPVTKRNFRQTRLRCFFEKGKFFYIEYNIRLLWHLLFIKADIICAVDLDTIMPCTFAGKLKGAKLVYDAHEYFTEVPEVIHRPSVQRAWKWVEKTFVPKMDACYTVSSSLAGLYYERYGKKFEVIRNVPLLGNPSPVFAEKSEEKFILYQGALNKGRGLEILIESMKQLPLKLILAGEGDLSGELKNLAKHLHLEEKVIFLGWVKPDDLRQLTLKAFIGYNLLENLGKSYYFSLSNKFFDYIHACVPGLSNPFPEYETLISEYNAGIVANLSVSDIVLRINKVLQDEIYYRNLRLNCDKARHILNWETEEKKLAAIYDAL